MNSFPNTESQSEHNAEPIPPCSAQTETANEPQEEITPLDFVKSIVGEVIGRYKLTFKDWEKYGSVYYRSCAICGFVYDEKHNAKAVKFMGTTLESRKSVTEHKIENPSDLHGIKAFILRQIEFTNWWWNDPQAKSGGILQEVAQ